MRAGQVFISAVDVIGRAFPLWSGIADAGEKELDVSILPSSIYTVLIDYGTKREAVRLVKEYSMFKIIRCRCYEE